MIFRTVPNVAWVNVTFKRVSHIIAGLIFIQAIILLNFLINLSFIGGLAGWAPNGRMTYTNLNVIPRRKYREDSCFQNFNRNLVIAHDQNGLNGPWIVSTSMIFFTYSIRLAGIHLDCLTKLSRLNQTSKF